MVCTKVFWIILIKINAQIVILFFVGQNRTTAFRQICFLRVSFSNIIINNDDYELHKCFFQKIATIILRISIISYKVIILYQKGLNYIA